MCIYMYIRMHMDHYYDGDLIDLPTKILKFCTSASLGTTDECL